MLHVIVTDVLLAAVWWDPSLWDKFHQFRSISHSFNDLTLSALLLHLCTTGFKYLSININCVTHHNNDVLNLHLRYRISMFCKIKQYSFTLGCEFTIFYSVAQRVKCGIIPSSYFLIARKIYTNDLRTRMTYGWQGKMTWSRWVGL